MEAEKSTVIKVSWLSDKIVEVLLQGDRKKYFPSPLKFVDEARREGEVQVGDIAVLAGQYMVPAVPNEEEANDTLIMTNYLRVSSIVNGHLKWIQAVTYRLPASKNLWCPQEAPTEVGVEASIDSLSMNPADTCSFRWDFIFRLS